MDKEKEKEDENADDRSHTPSSNLAHKKSFKRPWLSLSKADLANIIKNSQGHSIYYAQAKINKLPGRKNLNHVSYCVDNNFSLILKQLSTNSENV